jgi:lysophospholipase L1-like esterase
MLDLIGPRLGAFAVLLFSLTGCAPAGDGDTTPGADVPADGVDSEERDVGFDTRAAWVPPGAHWVTTWAAAMQPPLLGPGERIAEQTLRQVVHLSLGGSLIRIRFTNVFGSEPLEIDAASVALRSEGANLVAGSQRALSFDGARSVTILPGQERLSDPVQLEVHDEADLAVSTYVAKVAQGATSLVAAHQTTYLSQPGNHVADADFLVLSSIGSWLWLTDVEVNRPDASTVVAFGDSITEGQGSSSDLNARWPDVLARRLMACGIELSVANAGISGNRVLNDLVGPSAEKRFERDVLARSNVRYALLLEGINDIGLSSLGESLLGPLLQSILGPTVSAEEILEGYTRIVTRAHAVGISIYVGTLLPYGGSFYADEAGERKRQRINDWIRTSNVFDGFIDFDAVVRDPAHPDRLQPRYNSGDSLHPSDAGYAAMGQAIDLRLFGARACD